MHDTVSKNCLKVSVFTFHDIALFCTLDVILSVLIIICRSLSSLESTNKSIRLFKWLYFTYFSTYTNIIKRKRLFEISEKRDWMGFEKKIHLPAYK